MGIIKKIQNIKISSLLNLNLKRKIYIFYCISIFCISAIFITVYLRGKISTLSVVQDLQIVQLNTLFDSMQNHIHIFSSRGIIIDAILDFSRSFEKINSKLNADQNALLTDYYKKNFFEELNHSNQKELQLEDYYPTSSTTKILQYFYLIHNSLASTYSTQSKKENFIPEYDRVYSQYHEKLSALLDEYSYYDILLLDAKGNIIYTVLKELDFGTNVNSKMMVGTSISRLYQSIKDKMATYYNKNGDIENYSFFTIMSDVESYRPSLNLPSSFIATPIIKNHKFIGVFIAQLHHLDINKIMLLNERWRSFGFGYTGESFLIGSDFRTRSELRVFEDNRSVFFNQIISNDLMRSSLYLMKRINSSVALVNLPQYDLYRKALTQTRGFGIVEDIFQSWCFAIYKQYSPGGLHWAIITKISLWELLYPIIICITIIIIIIITIHILYVLPVVLNPMQILVEYINNISKGDLSFINTNIFDRNDLIEPIIDGNTIKYVLRKKSEVNVLLLSSCEAAENIRTMLIAIKKIALETKETSKNLISSSNSIAYNLKTQVNYVHEISTSIESLYTGIDELGIIYEEQFVTFSNLMIFMEKINLDVQMISNELTNISQLIGDIESVGSDGGKNVLRVQQTMISIVAQSQKMIEIVNVIRDISDQVNLLSLNANIESARIGDSRTSFAVVAKEIAELSDKTTSSIRAISTLIKSSSLLIHQSDQHIVILIDVFKKVTNTMLLTSNSIQTFSKFVKEQMSLIDNFLIEFTNAKNKSKDLKIALTDHKISLDHVLGVISSLNFISDNILNEVDKLNATSIVLDKTNISLFNEINYFKFNDSQNKKIFVNT